MFDPWEEGMNYASNGGTLSSLTTAIASLGLNAADGQAFTLGYLEGCGAAIGEGSRETMRAACDRFRRGARRR